jgi:probable F420-dependent oxidoreductase
MSAVAHPRRFRFGVEMMEPLPDKTWVESARHLEALGYSTLFVPDHMHEGYGPLVAMTAAAMATTSLVVAPMVFACDFRNPAVLARELASIDVLSEGRLEVGLGAGYNPLDYSRSGIPMDRPGVRIDRLIEHVAVLRGLFGPAPFTFSGEHYRIEDLDGTPKPYRPGGPPIIVAGGGKRLLTFAATAADIIGVNPTTAAGRDNVATAQDALPASIDTKFGWIREAAGDRFDSIEFTAWLGTAAVTNDKSTLVDKLSTRFGASADDVLGSPIVLVGSESEIEERLHERRERWGYSYTVLQARTALDFAPIVARLGGT